MTVRSFDLVVLDVQLPDENGYAIARHLRTLSPSLGIVMLTGYGSDRDHLRALDDGVDAYLFKPADIEKLAATLRNLMRRVGSAPATVNLQGRWRLADNGWRIVSPGDVEVGINLAERQVMRVLAASPGVPVRREMLIARLAEDVHDFDPHRLEMLVYRLRKKCQKAAQEELPLSAVRGVGYVLTW
jgi:DNA-binding response OmpR family regulator